MAKINKCVIFARFIFQKNGDVDGWQWQLFEMIDELGDAQGSKFRSLNVAWVKGITYRCSFKCEFPNEDRRDRFVSNLSMLLVTLIGDHELKWEDVPDGLETEFESDD